MLSIRPTKYQWSLAVDTEQLNQSLHSCPFCNSTVLSDCGIEICKKPSINLTKCNWCKAVFADRMPTDETLSKYYSDYYDGHDDVYKEQAAAVTHGSTNHFAKKITKLFVKYTEEKNINLLDFGGGDGSLGIAVKNALALFGVNVDNIYLVDISNVASMSGCTKFTNLESCGSMHFDLILVSAVLEHLTSPSKYLRQLASKGSYIYLRTPFITPLIRLASKLLIRIDFTYPGHVSDLGPEFYCNLGRCLPEFELELVYSGISPVETTFKQDFLRTFAAYLFKLPYYALRYLGVNANFAVKIWPYVGGWEALVRVLR